MNRLQNKVAIVTGGAHGIGAAIVQRFCEEGARVVLVDVNRDGGAAVAERWGATFVPTDVSNHTAVGELIAQTVRTLGAWIVSSATLVSTNMVTLKRRRRNYGNR